MSSIAESRHADNATQPCADCGDTFAGELLDDDQLCMWCELIRGGEDAEFVKDEKQAAHELDWPFDSVRLTDEWAEAQEAKAILTWSDRRTKQIENTPELKAKWDTIWTDLAKAQARIKLKGEPLSAFETPLDGPIPEPPGALLRRADGATLVYQGRLNWVYGLPSSGKTWLSLYCMGEALLRGLRVAYWDFDDDVGELQRRAAKLGIDLAHHWQEGQFKYWSEGLEDSALAMSEAVEWVEGSDGPALVVVDSVTSAGCPADGSPIMPWAHQFLTPFCTVGATVLALDHLPKRKEGRPLGPIGATQKLALLTGVALRVDGEKCWNEAENGYFVLTNEKDRCGALPAKKSNAVARVTGTWNEAGGLDMAFLLPGTGDDGNDLEAVTENLLDLITEAGPVGIRGMAAILDKIQARHKVVRKALENLLETGLIQTTQAKSRGKPITYMVTEAGAEASQVDAELPLMLELEAV